MPRTSAPSCVVTLFALALALALGSLAPAVAGAAEGPNKELRVPAAPSGALEQLAALLGAIDPELHAPFRAAVADAAQRLRASERAAAEGKGEPLAIRHACRAALREADVAGVSKRPAQALELLVDLAVLQLAVDLHAGLREGTGHQLAIRSVRACAGDDTCLDALVPTETMEARHITAVRTAFAGKAKELEAAERLGNLEVQQLGKTYSRTVELYSKIMQNAAEMKKTLISNFPR
jgi:hypothetical protein